MRAFFERRFETTNALVTVGRVRYTDTKQGVRVYEYMKQISHHRFSCFAGASLLRLS